MTSVRPRLATCQIVSDEDLARIARELTGWGSVAPFLSLSAAQREAIRRDYIGRTEEQKYEVLLTWKKNNPDVSFEDLADAFRQARREDMVAVTYEVAQNPAKPPQKCDVPDFCESKVGSKETQLCTWKRAALAVCGVFILVLVAFLVYLLIRNLCETAVSKHVSAKSCFGRVTRQRGNHNYLPKFDPPFIGRDKNVSDLISMILHGDSPVVHITGAPAIGKSHLALQVAWELIDYGVNIKYVDLSEKELSDNYNPTAQKMSEHTAENGKTSNSTEVAQRKNFELKFLWYSLKKQGNVIESTSDIVNWARSVTSPTVLVLDNCDDALQGNQKKAFLNVIKDLKRAHCVKIISTSIVNITTLGIRNYPLNPLDLDSAVDLLQKDSMECGEFHEVEKAQKVAILVGCNPYGLRLAAKVGCNALPIDDLIQKLSVNAIAPLDNEADTTDEEKLEYIIELAVTYLHEDTKLCAQNISLFPGSFSKEASLIVLSGSGVKHAEECLKILYRNSLLQRYDLDGVPRLRYHILIKQFFKNKADIKHEEERKFYEVYVQYFTSSILKTLNECKSVITDSRDCQDWFRREDYNTRHILRASSLCSPTEEMNTYIAWAPILTHPTFWRVYGTRELISFARYEVSAIFWFKSRQDGLLMVHLMNHPKPPLMETFDLLLKQVLQLQVYHYNSFFDSTFNMYADEDPSLLYMWESSGFGRGVTLLQTSKLCSIACFVWARVLNFGSLREETVLLGLCEYGCDPMCRYYITDICSLALTIALLMPHIKKSLRNHSKYSSSILGENFITVAVGLAASFIPARFISWLIQIAVLPLAEAGISSIGIADSQYLFGALLAPVAFSVSAVVSLMCGGFKPFFYFNASSVLLHFYGDYINLCLFSRLAVVVCVCRIVHVQSFLKQTCNMVCLALVVFGYWYDVTTTCLLSGNNKVPVYVTHV